MKQTNNKALILFFPHLFFVFLSPSVEYEMEDGELPSTLFFLDVL